MGKLVIFLIEVNDVTKGFDDVKALNQVNLTIKEGIVFGLVGTNGAGKSTLLRIISGIVKPEHGDVSIDGVAVGDNKALKEKFFFIADDLYYFPNSTPMEMGRYFCGLYPNFSMEEYERLLSNFDISPQRKINTLSKGMKKQLSIIAALSANTKYVFCDETFDGLDPVMRQGVKSLFAAALSERDFGVVVASHNLRELEDICDHVGLLHKGGVLLSKDLDDMKISIHKIQCIFEEPITKEHFADIEVLQFKRRGSLYTLVVRGDEEEILNKIRRENPVFAEVLPLSLEEIFISETGVKGYDIKKLVL